MNGYDPLNNHQHFQLSAIANPLNQTQLFDFDSANLLVDHRDAFNSGWIYSYDGLGNRLTAQDPLNLSRLHTWSYDTFNNVKTYIDPVGNITTYRYHYEDNPPPATGYPTLLTKITEPPAQSGGTAADTVLEYYIGNGTACIPTWDTTAIPIQCKHGLLKRVTDPNGVKTLFDYDTLGQRSFYGEGVMHGGSADTTFDYVYRETYAADARSRPKFNGWSCVSGVSALAAISGGGGLTSTDSENNPTGSICINVSLLTDPLPPPPGYLPNLPSTSIGPLLPSVGADWAGEYDGLGRVTSETIEYGGYPTALCNFGGCERLKSRAYNELNLMTSDGTTMLEQDAQIPRQFSHAYSLASGTMTRTGPDLVQTFVQYDVANRVSFMRRGPVSSPILTATYAYYPNGLVSEVTYGNAALVSYEYDSANRLTTIYTLTTTGQTYNLAYTYDPRDLPLTVTETSSALGAGTTTYSYDNRGRLKQEVRTMNNSYNLTYEYDQGGNRTKKINAVTGKEVRYTYDVADSSVSGTMNNRLLKSQEVLTATPTTIYNTTWYAYNCAGNANRVITNVAGTQAYTATRFSYAKNERTVLFALEETWNWDGNPSHLISGYAVPWLREFRYDSGRARYLNRKVDAGTMTPIAAETVWTDYDGDEAYGDFAILQSGQWYASNTRSYQPGIAVVDPWTNTGGANTKYYHTDHLGTTRAQSAGAFFSGPARIFTAFGERISGPTPPDRYGYVGAHGYQTHNDLPFQHVGARYYDPGSGRFLQRDPIGIDGGLNTYEYARSGPAMAIDPQGTDIPGLNPPPGGYVPPPPPPAYHWPHPETFPKMLEDYLPFPDKGPPKVPPKQPPGSCAPPTKTPGKQPVRPLPLPPVRLPVPLPPIIPIFFFDCMPGRPCGA